MPRVTVPEYSTFVDFPDGTPPEEMQTALATQFPQRDSLFERAKKGVTNFAVSTARAATPLAFAVAPLLSDKTKQDLSNFYDETGGFLAQNQPTAPQGVTDRVVDAVSGLAPAIATGPVGAAAILNNAITGTAAESQDRGDSALRTVGKAASAGAATAGMLALPVGKLLPTLAGAGGAVALSNADRVVQNALETDPARKREFDLTTNVLEPLIMQLGFGSYAHFQQARGASKIIDRVATQMENGQHVPQSELANAAAATQVYLRREKRNAAQSRLTAADQGMDARYGTEPVTPDAGRPVADSEFSPDFGRPAPPVMDAEATRPNAQTPVLPTGAHPDTLSIEVARLKQEHPYWSDAEYLKEAVKTVQTHNPEVLPAATDMSTVRPATPEPVRQSEDAPGLAHPLPIGSQEMDQRFGTSDRITDPAAPGMLLNPEVLPARTDSTVVRPAEPQAERPGEQAPSKTVEAQSMESGVVPNAAVKPDGARLEEGLIKLKAISNEYNTVPPRYSKEYEDVEPEIRHAVNSWKDLKVAPEVRRVPLSEIRTTQDWADTDRVAGIMKDWQSKGVQPARGKNSMPEVYAWKGDLYAYDGNHRVIAADLLGLKDIEATYVNLTPNVPVQSMRPAEFNHDSLPDAAVTAADSLALQNTAPHLKVAVVGTPAEVAALDLTGKTVMQHDGKAYAIDPAAAKEKYGSVLEAKRAIKAGGDSESEALGYPARPEGEPLQTAAVTKTGEVLTDPAEIKQAATAGEVAYAAEGAPAELAAKIEPVAEVLSAGKDLPPNSIVTQVNGLDGRPLGYEVTPHDGTPKGMHDAALKNARAMNDYENASNAETIHLVTDSTGKPTNRINARFGELEPLQPEVLKGGETNGKRNENADANAQGRQEGREGLLDAPASGDVTLLHTAGLPAVRKGIIDATKALLTTKAGLHLVDALNGIAKAVHPIARGAAARRTGEILIEQMGSKERQAEQFVGELNRSVTEKVKLMDRFQSSARTLADAVMNKMPEEARLDFMQRMDTGVKQETPQLQQVADTIQRMFERKVEQVRALGNGALENVRDNYFPHMWERNPAGAEADIMSAISKRPLEGTKAFTKARVFDDVAAGLAAGYKPISSNPLDLVFLKMQEMDRYITTHTALQQMATDGVVKLLPAGEKAPQGWTEIDGRYGVRNGTGEHYVAQESVAQVFNNYLSKGLYDNPYVGTLYTGYMGAANNLNMFQLGVGSAFHAGFTSGEAIVSHVALGLKEVAKGNLSAAAKYFAEAPAAPVTNALKGDRLIKALAGDGSDTTMAPILDMLEMAGARRVSQNERFFTNHTQSVLKNWADGKQVKSIAEAPLAAVEQMSRPILEWLVPRHKYGVFAEMAEQYLRNNPDATHEQVRTASQQIWNRVDSRLGQVVYDRLFAHAVAKNVVQGLIRAPGWTGGTILEVGGGFNDLANMLSGGGKRGELSDRAAYVLSLSLVTAVSNGIMTAAFTGDKPKGMDFLAFRDGGTDETGKPTRFILPTYAKDIFAYSQDWSKTLMDKTHPAISLAHDLIKNKDYYGVQIADPEANVGVRAAQQALYTVKAFEPFWMRGAAKTWDREGGADVLKQASQGDKTRAAARVAAPMVGVMPAASAFTNTPLEKFVNENIPRMDSAITPEAADHKTAVNALANQFARLQRTGGDVSAITAKAQEMYKAGALTDRDLKRIDEIVSSPRLNRNFAKLPYPLALKAFNEVASDEERKSVLENFGSKMDNWAERRPDEFKSHAKQIQTAIEHTRRLMSAAP